MKLIPVCAWFALVCVAAYGGAQEATPEQLHQFERDVRPLLLAHCIECHGAETQEAGLRLDSRAALLAGGDGGPVISTENPTSSRLLTVIAYTSDVQMPPDAKLTPQEIEAITAWLHNGAPWTPDSAQMSGDSDSPEQHGATPGHSPTRNEHWAFQPIRRHSLPSVSQRNWPRGAIDQFLLARLEQSNVAPSDAADRRTLIRRLSFDLIGLPPTFAETEAFRNDTSPAAYERLVDRLLASPHYGERWGRHWLDLARYADTKGYVFTQDPKYPFSYTYRDYVIRSLNEDLPYDQFIIEQLAADLLPEEEDPRRLAALGFLTLGRRFNNNVHDIRDDRIDVVTRGLLGLTVACARCHDHKYDPIPTADYYSLYGIFASCQEPANDRLPLIAPADVVAHYDAQMARVHEVESEAKALVDEKQAAFEDRLRRKVGDFFVATVARKDESKLDSRATAAKQAKELDQPRIKKWREFIAGAPGDAAIVFQLWRELAKLQTENFAQDATQIVTRLSTDDKKDGENSDGNQPARRAVLDEFATQPPTSMTDLARRYGDLFEAAYTRSVDVSESEPPSSDAQFLKVLLNARAPTRIEAKNLTKLLEGVQLKQYETLQAKIREMTDAAGPPPARAMVLNDSAKPHSPHIFLRGNSGRPGDAVPRRFLELLSGEERATYASGSGRLELAHEIVAENNPLTSRVFANRVWLHHFAAPLVLTPSDFGTRSDPPVHPELLDYLATELTDHGWSLKYLHRQIVTSTAYRQASDARPDATAIDPTNRLFWRMNRHRLEFEPMRDAVLAVSKSLETQFGGRGLELFGGNATARRSVYGWIDRQRLPGTLRAFDFASPDSSTPRRSLTTVPQQALFLMNSPFVVSQSKQFVVAALGNTSRSNHSAAIQALYQSAYGRSATTEEIQRAAHFLNLSLPRSNQSDGGSQGTDDDVQQLSAWERLAQAMLLSNEFVFVD